MPHTIYEPQPLELRCYESSGMHFPPHLHDAMEMLYVHQGAITVIIDRQLYTLQAGDFAIIFPNTIHSYENSSTGTMTLLIAGPSYSGSYRNTLIQYHPVHPIISGNQVHDNIAYAMGEILSEQQHGQSPAVTYALIQLILSRTIPMLSLEKNPAPETADITAQIIRYISEHFQEALSLETLSRALGVSKYYVSRVFSSKMNTRFHQYLNNIRLDHAAARIRSTDMSYTDIWIESGFESQRTFYRAFRQVYGMTPREYRYSTRKFA